MSESSQVPRVSIYLLIFALILALVAPSVVFLGFTIHRFNKEHETEVVRNGELLVNELTNTLEEEFRTLETMLAVFASSGWLDEQRYDLMHQRAVSALSGTGRYLIVLDDDFNQILNTRVPYGPGLGKTGDIGTAAQVLANGDVTVSNLFTGNVSGKLVFNVLRRVVLPDGMRHILILTRNADDLDGLFGPSLRSAGWSFAVFDGSGRLAMSSLLPEQSEQPIPDTCLDPVFGFQVSGSAESERYVLDRAVDRSSWRVCAWGAADRLNARTERSWTTFFTVALVWFGAALIAAVALSMIISRAIANAARVAEALDSGREITIGSSFVREVNDVLSSLRRAAAERLRRDEELRLLLRETAHRAKNQIAIATSLLGLSARNATDVEALRDDLSERLVALGRSIDMMSGTRFDTAPISELIKVQLTPFLDGANDRLDLEGEEVTISQNAAQSFGLVLHELATNASKYGAWSRPEGTVHIAWTLDNSDLVLEWSERGSPAAEPERKGFGTTLVDILIEKSFSGSIVREFTESGFTCTITVPLSQISVPPADDEQA